MIIGACMSYISLNTCIHTNISTQKMTRKIYTKMLTTIFFPLDINIMGDNFPYVFSF